MGFEHISIYCKSYPSIRQTDRYDLCQTDKALKPRLFQAYRLW